MYKLTGRISVHIFVDCPKCKETVDLIDLDDEDNKVGWALFGSSVVPAAWHELNIDCECPVCHTNFVLGELEY